MMQSAFLLYTYKTIDVRVDMPLEVRLEIPIGKKTDQKFAEGCDNPCLS